MELYDFPQAPQYKLTTLIRYESLGRIRGLARDRKILIVTGWSQFSHHPVTKHFSGIFTTFGRLTLSQAHGALDRN